MNRNPIFWALAGALLVSLPAAPASAGGWTQSPDAAYGKVWVTNLAGQGAYGLDGEAVNTQEFRVTKVSMYGEYGLAEDLTLVGFAEPIGSAKHGDANTLFAGTFLGGLRQRFVSDVIQLAVEVRGGGQPGFGERNLAAGAEDFIFVPAIGTGQLEWDLQLGLGLPFGWLALAGGPRLLTASALSNELTGFAQLGFGPFAGVVLDIHASANHSLEPLEVVNTTGVGNTRYVGLGLGVSYWPTDFIGIHVGADGAAYAASNARAPALQVGVEFRAD